MREQKANDNGFPVVGKQAKEQQIFPFEQLVEYDGATNKITINANLTINGDTNIGELDIDSGDAPKGQVLTANGESGASWKNRVEYLNLESESGNLTNAQIEVAEQDNVVIQLNGQFYYKNSQSDEAIVFKAPAKVVDDDTIVEKVVVNLSDNTYSYSYEVVAAGNSFEPVYDDELNDSSTNAVQNKAIYAALEEKANVDGNYPTMTVGLSDNLVATNGLTTTNSFIMELTGGDQASAVSTGNMNLTLRGNSVVVNQQRTTKSGNVNDTVAQWSTGFLDQTQIVYGHKYLTFLNYKIESDNEVSIYFKMGATSLGQYAFKLDATKTQMFYVAELSLAGGSASMQSYFHYYQGGLAHFSFSELNIIDLTQWFNGDIPQDILDNPENFINYYQGSLAYNTGELVSAQSTSLIGRGINQWDEVWELGRYYTDSGLPGSSTTQIRNKNIIKVIPNAQYYFKLPNSLSNTDITIFCYDINNTYLGYYNPNSSYLFTPANNCDHINITLSSIYGTTYNHDICINVSNPDINGNYYEYEKEETSLGNDVLRSAGSAYDSKPSSGLITRRIKVVDMGTPNWSSGYNGWIANISDIKQVSDNNTKANILCAKYQTFTANENNGICLIANGTVVRVIDPTYADATAFKQAMSGVPLYYEIEEPTEEQGTPFSENIKVVKGGTLEFVGNGIPQGNAMFFQKNLKSFLEAFGTAINYDPSRIERLANLSFTPETADIVLNPSPTNAYAKVQVMSSTFTIVVSAALTGTASGSITFQDSEVDLTNFQTKPAEAIYDMDGKKVSEAPTTTDCNIASFVGRSYNGVILWSILHSGVNKIKIHFEQAISLDENGNGKVDCRASLIL